MLEVVGNRQGFHTRAFALDDEAEDVVVAAEDKALEVEGLVAALVDGVDVFPIQSMKDPKEPYNMKESQLVRPVDTIVFGEKKHTAPDDWMDILGEDGADVAQYACHSKFLTPNTAGGSNYAFADGNVRYLKFGLSIWPIDMWAVTDASRTATAVPLGRITLGN